MAPAPQNVDPRHQSLLTKWGVQDFAEELRFEPAEKLKRLFHHASGGKVHLQKLLYNLVWQAYTWIKAGKREPIDGNLRTMWYTDIKPPLSFLGLLEEKPAAIKALWKGPRQHKFSLASLKSMGYEWAEHGELRFSVEGKSVKKPSTAQYLYDQMTNVFYDFVSNEIFHFRDFDFVDDYAPFRFIGGKHPNVIFFAEKMGFVRFAEEVFKTYDCTSICLGGEPKLLSSEYFTTDLAKSTSFGQPFTLLACVDYDPFGSIIAEEFRKQLSFFGVKKSRLEMLVTQKTFTDKELDIYPYKLPINNKRMKTIVENWIKETGGVKGMPYGIQCDIVPKDRIRSRLDAVTHSGSP